MSPLRGKTSVNISMIEESSLFPAQTKKTPFTDYRSNLSKSLFYACSICEGPLVPVSYCTFCKKTSLRVCTRCNCTRDIQNHDSCKSLLSFAGIIFKNKDGFTQ